MHGGQDWMKVDLPGLSTATLDSFTCAECGYTEFYSDQGGLRNIRSSGRFIQGEGSQFSQGIRRCPVCDTEVRAGMGRCPECGYSLN